MSLLPAPLSLARWPLRLTLLIAERSLSAAAEVARMALDILEEPVPETRVAPPRPARPQRADGRPPAAPPEPDHVDEEVVLVAEVAEAGAEEGAGAEVHVDEPWEGYRAMSAADIRARLADAGPGEAAAVKLYEAAHKERSSVIEAADRRLRG
jgi:hypothetical protein